VTGEPVLRIREVAVRLDVCARTVRRWIAAGKLPAIRQPGRQWRVPVEAVRAFAETRLAPDPEGHAAARGGAIPFEGPIGEDPE
jgi:excisionase family DNA binding protein